MKKLIQTILMLTMAIPVLAADLPLVVGGKLVTASGLPVVIEPSWTPSDITTELWLDADDSATLTTNITGSVSRWSDKSGNVRDVVQGTGSYQPISGTRTIGGLNALDFQGGSDRLLRSGDSIDVNTISVFAVYDLDSVAGYITQILKSTTPYDSIRFGEDGGTMKVGSRTSTFGLNTITVGTSLSAGILSYRKNGASDQEAWLNGTSLGTQTTTLNLDSPNLNLLYAGWGLNGLLGEVIWVTGAISASDRQKMEGYLAWKWGLVSNLPSGHPYKNSPPTNRSLE